MGVRFHMEYTQSQRDRYIKVLKSDRNKKRKADELCDSARKCAKISKFFKHGSPAAPPVRTSECRSGDEGTKNYTLVQKKNKV